MSNGTKILQNAEVTSLRQLKIVDDNDFHDLNLSFLYKHFTHTFFPYRRMVGNIFERKNEFCTLTLVSTSEQGLPYGIIPRLLMIWIISKAVQRQSSTIYFPNILSNFAHELGLNASGGVRGDITRLKEQFHKILHTAYTISFEREGYEQLKNVFPVQEAQLWWDVKKKNSLTDVYIKLSEPFFQEILNKSVPLNLSYIKQLSSSSLALDIYAWLAYRLSYLKEKLFIPWPALKSQFGYEYKDDNKGLLNFKAAFTEKLEKVLTVYYQAKLYESADKKGIYLYPSPLSVPRKHVALIYENKNLSNVSERVEISQDVDVSSHPYIETIVREYGLSATLAPKLIKNMSDTEIHQAILSVSELVKTNKARSKPALMKKALEEKWVLPQQSKAVIMRTLDAEAEEVLPLVWKEVRKKLTKRFGEGTTISWFSKLEFMEEDSTSGAVTFNVPTHFVREWILQNYKEYIIHSWQEYNPDITQLILRIK